ncbi:hypothetical protein X777_01302 [Ooceraea biroi]|uniref:Uncharacterized protein n=1 Tax=Ooceraea biroi TaxID=2015173 RepID=A0A026WQP1_OOCBI|nr:hypothetical protein X777_01302 [Ooceraea biroi]
MASSPTSIENQIDSFLEQFKRSASRAMEETHAAHHHHPGSYNACSSSISRSRSGNLDLELLEAGEFVHFDQPGSRPPSTPTPGRFKSPALRTRLDSAPCRATSRRDSQVVSPIEGPRGPFHRFEPPRARLASRCASLCACLRSA